MEFRNDLVKGSITPVILKLLAERELYGYDIVKVVNERTGGALEWKEGTLYPCLHQLESDGLLSSEWRATPSGKSRKYYRITRRGRAELAHRVQEWTRFSTAVNAVLLASPA